MRPLVSVALLWMAASPGRPVAPSTEPAVVQPNDNRAPAGTRHGDTLFVRLVVSPAMWTPQADSGPAIRVEAIGEEGKAPQIPAPLIRARVGTPIVATVRN